MYSAFKLPFLFNIKIWYKLQKSARRAQALRARLSRPCFYGAKNVVHDNNIIIWLSAFVNKNHYYNTDIAVVIFVNIEACYSTN